MDRASNQTKFGKAFEYACVTAFYNACKNTQHVVIENTPQLQTAKNFFQTSGEKQKDFISAANAAVRAILRLEPRLEYPDNDMPLVLSLQKDAAGQKGDVRDVLCTRGAHGWQIGFSCKHNHEAVKHSRLSDTIDFGDIWFGHPCSQTYFFEVVPKFTELRNLRDDSRHSNAPALWSDLPDKAGDYYEPILQSFMDELRRLADTYSDVPEKLVRYLIGRHDFYKIITDDTNRTTRIEAINISGTLNNARKGHKSSPKVSILKMPTTFHNIDFKKENNGVKSQNTIQVTCDNGWQISMRLHNASSRIEPSLKFDIKLISTPSSLFTHTELWDQ